MLGSPFRITCLLFLAALLCVEGAAAISAKTQQLLDACLGQDEDAVLLKNLLEDGSDVDVNVRDPRSGQTPLMASVLRGKTDFVRIVLAKGADATIAEKDGYTPPHGAAFQGRTEVLKVLIEHGAAPQEFHSDGYLPFHRACWGKTQRHSDFVAYLLESGMAEYDVLAKNGKQCRDMTKNPATLALLEEYEGRAKKESEL